MNLFPTKYENGKIEYKIRYKGRSRPFSRAKALVTSEQSRDPTKLKELLSQVLTITLDVSSSCSRASIIQARESTLRSNKVKMLRGEGSHATLGKKEVARGARRLLEGVSELDREEIERLREERRTDAASMG
ncbi:unnamed protein product [Microthlaspi erraticum]|uniref:Uncharacterized protein n=1 Tax=Microthlaspi erraticum TaxID=1685480 RepID=A0A6D2JJR3_9BRAS|nr:unnamed protein product [Microthlaspi erraticum]